MESWSLSPRQAVSGQCLKLQKRGLATLVVQDTKVKPGSVAPGVGTGMEKQHPGERLQQVCLPMAGKPEWKGE